VRDAVRDPGARGDGEEHGSTWLARGCLAVVVVVVFIVVVVPALIWAAGILLAGGR
jgi:hypothetical protein